MQMPTTRTPTDWRLISPNLLLYVFVPLVLLAVPLGLFRAITGASLVLSLYFWSATVMVGWLSGALCSWFLYRICAPLRPPLWAICLLGPLLAGMVLHAPIVEILSITKSSQIAGAGGHAPVAMSFTWNSAERFVLSLAPGTIVWIGINYVFDSILGIPRYQYAPKSDGANNRVSSQAPMENHPGDAAFPPLIERLPRSERAPIVAIKAEDHYVRIYTDTGDGLTLLRMRDAISLTEPTSGMQVHRSAWVADRAIENFRRTGHTGRLLLSNGLVVQVSRSFCRAVELRVQQLPVPAKPATKVPSNQLSETGNGQLT